MGEKGGRQFCHKHHNRIQDPLHQKTPSHKYFRPNSELSGDKVKLSNGVGNKRLANNWCYRAGLDSNGVPVSHVPEAKIGRNLQTNFQPKDPQQIFKAEEIQVYQHAKNPKFSATRGLHPENRHFQGLLPRPYRRKAQTILNAQNKRKSLSNDLSTIRPGNCPPQTFAKITNWVASLLRNERIRVVVYLDGFLLAGQNPSTLAKQGLRACQILQKLGWHLNQEKTNIIPTQKQEYLGITWNTQKNTKSIDESKKLQTWRLLSKCLKEGKCSWLEAKRLLGRLTFASFVVPYGRLHCRFLQRDNNKMQRYPKAERYILSADTLNDCKWWLQHLSDDSEIFSKPVTMFITTDLIGLRLGSFDKWKTPKRHVESQATSVALQQKRAVGSICHSDKEQKEIAGHELSSAVRQQNCRSLLTETGRNKIAVAAENYKSNLSADVSPEHKPYSEIHSRQIQRYCDSLSRHQGLPEWSLSNQTMEIIFKKWGIPQVDLFASAQSAVVPFYVTEAPQDPNALFTDAFSRQWNWKLAWVFPPPCLMARVLCQLNKARGTYLIACPKWNKVFWRADLKSRATAVPFTIQNLQSNLIDRRTNLPPPEVKQLQLEVWRVQGGPLT